MENMVIDSNFWKNKKVFLTGHTGFKGSWMSLWLLKLGADVVGYSKGIPTNPSLFEDLNLDKEMHSIIGDINDSEFIKKKLTEAQPDLVIHMAAQPLVRYSYQNPIETYMTNVMGVVNVFEACRVSDSVKMILNVTSDKCYENLEQDRAFVESDPMGGFDPYSSSKGCAELVTTSYRNSFMTRENKKLATGRAGNVIGGGDWASDRIIPDIARSVLNNAVLEIRSPDAIRPWQHVLEPLSGYLLLAQKAFEFDSYAKSYNFGPLKHDHCSVEAVLKKSNEVWSGKVNYKITKSPSQPHEAHYLKLDCSRAVQELNWKPRWSIDQAIEKTISWYIGRMQNANIRELTLAQLSEYDRRG